MYVYSIDFLLVLANLILRQTLACEWNDNVIIGAGL